MRLFGWEDCPQAVQSQVKNYVGAMRRHLADNLIGVYLHGSLAMGCFNPETSDIDLLVVTRQGMSLETKRAMIELLLRFSARPRPIEISFLREQDLEPWQHPTPFDLHYSETGDRSIKRICRAVGGKRGTNNRTTMKTWRPTSRSPCIGGCVCGENRATAPFPLFHERTMSPPSWQMLHGPRIGGN
jgi:predicted nucleotidyltransferase